jgi:hypothetical protein
MEQNMSDLVKVDQFWSDQRARSHGGAIPPVQHTRDVHVRNALRDDRK